jgi:hypothetical protein
MPAEIGITYGDIVKSHSSRRCYTSKVSSNFWKKYKKKDESKKIKNSAVNLLSLYLSTKRCSFVAHFLRLQLWLFWYHVWLLKSTDLNILQGEL